MSVFNLSGNSVKRDSIKRDCSPFIISKAFTLGIPQIDPNFQRNIQKYKALHGCYIIIGRLSSVDNLLQKFSDSKSNPLNKLFKNIPGII